MAAFSAALKLADLNDFIAPSQACVVSLEGSKQSGAPERQAEVGVHVNKRSKGFQQTEQANAGGPIKVTLHDCLACSGCVTSAETVLLQHQSGSELLAKLADPQTAVVITLSPQSIASFAAFYGMQLPETAARLASFFRSLGAARVFDSAWSRDVALLEVAHEFVERYQATGNANSPRPPHDMDDRTQSSSLASTSAAGPLPMLASACPGWVCYAEKTHGHFVLPYISSTKSPQAVMGSVIKRRYCEAVKLRPEAVYHCAVMPCYDKKLEASREDFYLPGSSVPETDSVLATSEVFELLEQHGVHLPTLPCTPVDLPFTNTVYHPIGAASFREGTPDMLFHGVRGGSGGYLEYVFRTAARALFGNELPAGPLPLRTLRNINFQEVSLEIGGKTVLRFASVYGFRNIQALMRKIKSKACVYDYIEIMACPSGCLNGGGQLKAAAGQTSQQLLAALDEAYHGAGMVLRLPEDNPSVRALYDDWAGPVGSERAHELFHTRYHLREKTVTALLGDW